MYNVALNSDIDSNSINKTFSCYTRARDYANRLFHKRYTLSIREQGYPADDFIVFLIIAFRLLQALDSQSLLSVLKPADGNNLKIHTWGEAKDLKGCERKAFSMH